jgi:CO/xanthine dehydrogenase Mo-binding subunit
MNYVPSDLKVVGTRPIRPDGVDKVTGRAQFGADMVMPGMLWGKVKRSPHAHARIVSIDASKALKLPGVKAVVTADDFPDIPSEEAFVGEGPMNFRDLSRNCMARGKALYEGHAVAAVAATSQAIADEALELLDVKYEVLPYVIDVEAAMAPDAPVLHDDLFTAGVEPKPTKPSNIAKRVYFHKGDAKAGFAQAEVIVEGRYTTEPVHQAYIEPHACVCQYGADGQSVIFSSSQGQFMTRSYVAKLLGMDIANIRATAAEIGGGFGGKTLVYLEPLALALSKKCGRPVKMQMTREEVFRASGPTSGATMEVKLGAKKDGTIVAAQHVLRYQAGAFPERRGHRLRRGVQPAEGGGVSRTRRPDRVVRGRMRDGRPCAQARQGPDRTARAERRAQRHQDALRADPPEHRVPRHAERGEVHRALEVTAEAGPGTRHRHRLLVQHRRRVIGGGACRRGRLGQRCVGQP